MQIRTLHRLCEPRHTLSVWLITASLLLGGCGSSHSASTPSSSSSSTSTARTTAPKSAPLCPGAQRACISQSPQAKVTGPKALAANLIKSIARTNSELKHVKLDCPHSSGYPTECHLTGTERLANGKLVPAVGTVKVLGVDTKTHTYVYTLSARPARL